MMQINFDLDANDEKAFRDYYNKHDKRAKLFGWIHSVILFVALLCLFLITEIGLVGFLIFYGSIIIYYWWLYPFLQKKIMSNPEVDSSIYHHTATFTEEGVEVEVKDTKSQSYIKLVWSAIVKVGGNTKYFFLYIQSNQAIIIPREKISAIDDENIKALLNDKVKIKLKM